MNSNSLVDDFNPCNFCLASNPTSVPSGGFLIDWIELYCTNSNIFKDIFQDDPSQDIAN